MSAKIWKMCRPCVDKRVRFDPHFKCTVVAYVEVKGRLSSEAKEQSITAADRSQIRISCCVADEDLACRIRSYRKRKIPLFQSLGKASPLRTVGGVFRSSVSGIVLLFPWTWRLGRMRCGSMYGVHPFVHKARVGSSFVSGGSKIIERTIMSTIKGILFWAVAATISTRLHMVSAQFPNCTKANTAFCESPVNGLTNDSIIFRCTYDIGQATPGNCNDE
jgi:hypothetical protein